MSYGHIASFYLIQPAIDIYYESHVKTTSVVQTPSTLRCFPSQVQTGDTSHTCVWYCHLTNVRMVRETIEKGSDDNHYHHHSVRM